MIHGNRRLLLLQAFERENILRSVPAEVVITSIPGWRISTKNDGTSCRVRQLVESRPKGAQRKRKAPMHDVSEPQPPKRKIRVSHRVRLRQPRELFGTSSSAEDSHRLRGRLDRPPSPLSASEEEHLATTARFVHNVDEARAEDRKQAREEECEAQARLRTAKDQRDRFSQFQCECSCGCIKKPGTFSKCVICGEEVGPCCMCKVSHEDYRVNGYCHQCLDTCPPP